MGAIKILLTAALGGIVTGIMIPIANYFIPRLFNRCRLKITLEKRKESNYSVYNLRVHNKSFSTIKNAYAHVTIDNEINDIKSNELRIKSFCSDSKIDYGMLSWSKNVVNTNNPYIDINQGESPDLNFIRLHDEDVIEVASEQGFFDEEMKTKARVVIKSHRNFKFQVIFTADNLWPVKRNYSFNLEQQNITPSSA